MRNLTKHPPIQSSTLAPVKGVISRATSHPLTLIPSITGGVLIVSSLILEAVTLLWLFVGVMLICAGMSILVGLSILFKVGSTVTKIGHVVQDKKESLYSFIIKNKNNGKPQHYGEKTTPGWTLQCSFRG